MADDPIRVAVVGQDGTVVNAVMVMADDKPPDGFRFIEDEAALCIPGDTWDGEKFISPEGIVRAPYVIEPFGAADNPEPESL